MNLNVTPTAGTPAPYGRACSQCARAKAKCTTIAGNGVGGKCERCLRLNKDCQPMQTVRKRKTVDRPSVAKTERLEAKLDGLFKLLQSPTPTPSLSGPSSNVSAPTAPILTGPLDESLLSRGACSDHGIEFVSPANPRLQCSRPSIDDLRPNAPTSTPDAPCVPPGTRPTTYHCPEGSPMSDLELSSDEAEECLTSFRTNLSTYFPFVHVPESTSVYELRRERPFLWLCMMATAPKFTARMKAFAKEMKLTLAREIIVEGKNNIDLLLGLLVFVAWGHYNIYDKPILIQSIQLAIALVGNLGLNKPPLKESTQMMLNLDARGCPIKPFNPSVRTTEEQRAVLGCFLLSSVISSYFQRVDALRWTRYLEDCAAALADRKELPSDTLLIHLVKLQLIVEKVNRGPWHEEHDEGTGSGKAPSIFYIKALQVQLQDFKARIPGDIQKNDVLLLHLHSTEFKIHEIAISKAPVGSYDVGFQRVDILYGCLQATKKWFDLFLSFPSTLYVGFSIAFFTQMAHGIIILFRLLTMDEPLWDRGVARETANLSHILEQLIIKYSQVKAASNLDHGFLEDNDIFSGSSRFLGSIKTWFDAKVAAEQNDKMALDETLGEFSLDCLDDVWLREIFSQGDGQFDLNM